MNINKTTKSFETLFNSPRENWTDKNDVFVVEDGSPLAQKIELNAPYFDFVLDSQGNLIDITPTERPPEPIPGPTAEERLTATEGVLMMLLMPPM